MSGFKFWLVFVIFILVTTLVMGFGWLRSSLPQTDGVVTLNGVKETVTVARDQYGVPHISANNEHDLQFALGFVHAQDRLWQMEMNRRIGHGRLSEIVGSAGLGFDRYMRTLGFSNYATESWQAIPTEVKPYLQAYADGVNEFLKQHRGALPPEFVITGVTPEPWHPVDTLVWQKMMWLSLSGNMNRELARADLLRNFTPKQVATLFPTYPGDTETPLPELSTIFDKLPIKEIAAVTGAPKEEGLGSNNWVVDGSRTESGKPLLANDPHLGLTTPSIWYLVRLHLKSDDTNVVGAGFPGTPSIILGRNDHIAWGFTNTNPDIQDLFIEKLVGDGSEYLTPDGPAPFEYRNELIKVRGGDDVTLRVRETRHGPVMSDIVDRAKDLVTDDYVLALQWTALNGEDTGAVSIFKMAKAKNFEEFKTAAQYYLGPQQNMIYADTSGNIGYYAHARVPIRHPDNEINGRLPSPGWLAKYDWQGFIPQSEVPERFNPEEGLIATANEKVIDDSYPYFITRDWATPYRGNRIRAELRRSEKHNLDSFKALHGDTISDFARDVVPHLLPLLSEDDPLRSALAGWDGNMRLENAEPLIFETWLRHYNELLMRDQLGDDNLISVRLIKSSLAWSAGITESDSKKAYYALPVLAREPSLFWCDNVETSDFKETCSDLANAASAAAWLELNEKFGSNWRAWQWGAVHQLRQDHRPLSQVPVIGSWFDIRGPQHGHQHTVNVAGNSRNPQNPHTSTFGPSYRGLFDLSNLDKSLYVQPTGQSGNPLSRNFDDLFQTWTDVEYFTIPTDKQIPDNTVSVLTLSPAENVH